MGQHWCKRQRDRDGQALVRGAPLHAQAGTKERLPGTNKGTRRNKEIVDELLSWIYPPRSARG